MNDEALVVMMTPVMPMMPMVMVTVRQIHPPIGGIGIRHAAKTEGDGEQECEVIFHVVSLCLFGRVAKESRG